MNTQEIIEQVAAAIYNGDMTIEEAEAINEGEGFTIDHDADDSGNFSRTEGVKLTAGNFYKAVKMAESGDFPY